MSDIKLFSLANQKVTELIGSSAPLEKTLQKLIESYMEPLLGVRFLNSEHATGKLHKGRIDSLGLDENGCPVIVEYKRNRNDNVINQGLFYLDWLLDHRAEFQLLVQNTLGAEQAETIEWSGTRLLCIAADFNRYDEHAVQQIDRNIELIRYRYFGEALLLLELVNSQSASGSASFPGSKTSAGQISTSTTDKNTKPDKRSDRNDSQQARIAQAGPELLALYQQLCDYADSLGDEVQRKELKFYTAFKRLKNFVSILVWPVVRGEPCLRVFLKIDPDSITLELGFTHDMRNKGHWGTGDLEVVIHNKAELEKALPLILSSYENN